MCAPIHQLLFFSCDNTDVDFDTFVAKHMYLVTKTLLCHIIRIPNA